MRHSIAKKIGGIQGLFSVMTGLFMALVITIFFFFLIGSGNFIEASSAAFRLISNLGVSILVGMFIMIFCGFFFGQIAGLQILIKKRNASLVGLICGITVLLCTALLSGLTGFITEGFDNIGTEDNPFEDYFFKPFFWITLFGFVPALFVGNWLGKRIKRNGEKIESKNKAP